MTLAPDQSFLESAREGLHAWHPHALDGRVRAVVGQLVEAEGIRPGIGTCCEIECRETRVRLDAEVVGFRDDVSLLMPFGRVDGLGVGASVRIRGRRASTPAGTGCLGRVLDGMGRPIDGGPPLANVTQRALDTEPEAAVTRERIERPLDLGLRAVNSFATLGEGMRMGIFAGSGVGKSTLLGQFASQADVDVSVIALIGERRREVREFLERDLGDALARSVVVVSTSDESALLRVRAARVATALAEEFRDQGQRVLLMMDSLTRFCTASREIGLARGEPPTTRGYTPSVWSELPRLLERAGTSHGRGSITGLYTVLVEGDDMNEPVADAARSLLDGHLELSRAIAERGRYPAIDILSSLSRVMPDVTSPEHRAAALQAREVLALYRDVEDLISVGAYQAGADPRIDRARVLEPLLQQYLTQPRGDVSRIDEGIDGLRRILAGEVA